jgi:uncharacterized protein (TIGR02145 family)
MKTPKQYIPKGIGTILNIVLLFLLFSNFGCSERVEGNYVKKEAGKDTFCPDKVTDIEGNRYATARIGDQCWMAENLKTERYGDGAIIKETWVVDGDEANEDKLGRLYNWHAVSNSAGLCPTDWRVATDDDYKRLEFAVGMDPQTADETGWRKTDNESRKLKKYDNAYSWTEEERQSINSSGFSAIASGARTDFLPITMDGAGLYGDYWTATEYNEEKAWNRTFVWIAWHPGVDEIYRSPVDKDWAFAVRCIKD